MSGQSREMNKGEREELKRLARERARVAKNDAKRRSADLLADFEIQVASEYDFNRDDVWKAAVEAAEKAAVEAAATIADRCVELGIPRELAPTVSFMWHGRGPGAVNARQNELRRVARQRIEAMERAAVHEIDRKALEVQTELVRAGLTSEAALDFLASMPSVDALMPAIDIRELEAPRGNEDLW